VTETAFAPATLKAELLANGVRPTEAFLAAYGPPYLEKRRAYGNPDDLAFVGRSLPQEMYLLPSRLICSVNVRSESTWELDWSAEDGFGVRRGAVWSPLSFPLTPAFYQEGLPDGRPARSVVTLYGGGSLGVFVRGECALVEMGKACQYCSISPNRSRQIEFPPVVSESLLRAALRVALSDRECPVSQIMINGGNFSDPNRSFLYYARLCQAAREAIADSGREIELHLIVYPPADLGLLQALAGIDVAVAMNMEVFDPSLFERYCPGKRVVLGQKHILAALFRAAEVLGPGKVFSILVGGLEPQGSMDEGMAMLAGEGVTPVINVFHPDPETPLESFPAPTVARILEMGRSLQAIFSDAAFARPFYLDCGRNSLDTEAFLRLF
jgi:hypothetical protein